MVRARVKERADFLKECVWAEADFASHFRIEVGASSRLSEVNIGPLTRHTLRKGRPDCLP